MYLLTISYGSFAVDQTSGDGLNQWMISNPRILSEELLVQTLSCSTRELLQHWTKSSRIPASRKRSVWRKWKLTKKTVSFVEDRSLTWSTNTSGSLEPMILSRIMQTYLQLFFEMMMFRNSIQNGTKFSLSMTQIPSDDILESLYTLRIRVWETQDRIGIAQQGGFIRRKLNLIITDWRQW